MDTSKDFRVYKVEGGEPPLLELFNRYSDTWLLRWKGLEDDTIVEAFVYPKPTMERIKEVILGWHNQQINEAILSGHKWREMPVWLSSENQQNYKASFDLAMQFSGQGGTLPLVYKFGTEMEPIYHRFETLEELRDFYLSTVSYVKEVLATGWERKDSIDWSVYEEALKAYE